MAIKWFARFTTAEMIFQCRSSNATVNYASDSTKDKSPNSCPL